MELHEENLSALADDARAHVRDLTQDIDDMEFYVVGGAVRDALMDREYNDLDFVVVGEAPEDMMHRGFNDIEATSFPVFMDSEGMEWALARTENKAGSGYHGFEIETEDVGLWADLNRRDLTINAMALDPFRSPDEPRPNSEWDRETKVVDVYGGEEHTVYDRGYRGIDDLEDEVLRPNSEKFKEDPIRVLRLARYAARFGFDVSDEAVSMSREIAYELNRCSRERLGDEIVKAMEQAEEPRRFWEVLRDTGALAVIFPELDRATLVPAGPEAYHMEGDTFEHTMMVLDRMNELCEEQDLRGDPRVRRLLMAVAHDIGKVIVADDKGGLLSDPPTRFGGHAHIGAKHVPHIAQSMGLEKQYEKAMQDAADYHMDFFDVGKTVDHVDDHESRYGVEWVYSFLSNFDHEHDPATSKVYGATPDEMLDLTQADHEGRDEPVGKTEEDGRTISIGPSIFQSGTIELDNLSDDVSLETERPTLDREPYERVMSAVYDALSNVDGFEAMRTGLCDEHQGQDPHDEELSDLLARCDDCRTPDAWIGETIDQMALEMIREELQ